MPVVLLLHMVVPPLLPSGMTDYRLGLMSGQIFVCLARPLVNFSINVFKYLLAQPGVRCLRLRLKDSDDTKIYKKITWDGS